MTEQELIQENAKLNARLQKAVTVFNEQKATIQRLTEERDAAIAKTQEANEQDQLFFEQQQEIETLKTDLENKANEISELADKLEDASTRLKEAQNWADEVENKLNAETETNEKLSNENTVLTGRLKKAAEEYEKLKEVNGILLNRNEAATQFISKIEDDCMEVLKQMQQNKMQ